MPTESIKRGQAQKLIDKIRVALLDRSQERLDDERTVATICHILADAGIEPLRPCEGEAHRNMHIDHCGACMPRWGVVGHVVRVL